ncbi:MAG: hypothetical protein QOJ81_578 [Chloroflexota bacterium]|jgi:uncharacterized Ntn-hydrolase superfamily protein|nr:hypothetical protein [Chloroflexota bacterium]
MTFSIVARDPATGDLGIAVASKFLAVGAVVPHARANVGAVATQALANVRYGAEGLALLTDGLAAADALARLTGDDEGRDHRQAGIVDAAGRSASYTGSGCITWAGGRTADGVAAQGNLLAGSSVVDALLETYLASKASFPERLLAGLKAADEQGGDRRGRESAALLVVRDGGGYGGATDRWIDLRVDDHPDPMTELARLLDLNHLYLDRPAESDLLPIDEDLATELRRGLTALGYSPDKLDKANSLAEIVERSGVTRTGEPRELPSSWDVSWTGALDEWMSIENLEERATARGWIDPRVLEFLRAKEAAK